MIKQMRLANAVDGFVLVLSLIFPHSILGRWRGEIMWINFGGGERAAATSGFQQSDHFALCQMAVPVGRIALALPFARTAVDVKEIATICWQSEILSNHFILL